MSSIKRPLITLALVAAAAVGGVATAHAVDGEANHYGTLYVLCQKVGHEPGWEIVVSQNNDAPNKNRFLLATTDGISVQDARAKYDASQCAAPGSR